MRAGLFLAYWPCWYGVPFTRPLRRTREYVEIVRAALARQGGLSYQGEEWTLPHPGGMGLGKPLKLLVRPVQERIPVYFGAIGPKAIEQTGEIADGWLPFMLDPTRPEVLLDALDRGLEKAGRARADIDIAATVPVSIDDDLGAARDAVRPWIAWYLGAMGAPEKNFYVEVADRYGHGEAARAAQRAFLAGDRAGAAAALTDELLDATTLATTPAGLDERLADYERAGVTTLVAVPCGDRERVARVLAAALAPGPSGATRPTTSSRATSAGGGRPGPGTSSGATSAGGGRPGPGTSSGDRSGAGTGV